MPGCNWSEIHAFPDRLFLVQVRARPEGDALQRLVAGKASAGTAASDVAAIPALIIVLRRSSAVPQKPFRNVTNTWRGAAGSSVWPSPLLP